MTTPRALRLDPSDNVVIAIDEIAAGAAPAGGVSARERVPKGHKMAAVGVEAGAPIRKFGQIIGFASRPIAAGEWVHEHNCAVKEFARDYHFGEDTRRENIVP
ncbi:UxaA family hydrolase, partial [Roseiarcus sp.]